MVFFLISFSEQAIIAAAGRRLRRREASNAAGAHVQSNFMSLARSFLLYAVCAKKFLFLSIAGVSNNQTDSPKVAMGSIAFVFVVHSMAFFLTAVRGNLCRNV